MASNVFISFRFSDGHIYKEFLSRKFDSYYDTVDYSEDVNRSFLSDATIQSYLYKKLRRSSVTIVLLTPNAINHEKDYYGRYADWMYDEIRYSLENREGNRTNGLIAVYTPEAERYLVENTAGGKIVKDVDNLFRANMMNVKPMYKRNSTPGWFDGLYDSYCSLVPYDTFVGDIGKYIENALQKRDEKYKYDIVCRL